MIFHGKGTHPTSDTVTVQQKCALHLAQFVTQNANKVDTQG